MINKVVVVGVLLFWLTLTAATARAQGVSPAVCPSNNKLICTLPEAYGPNGLQQKIGPLLGGAEDGTSHSGGHFENSFLRGLGALNASVGSQLTFLPLGSPGSGLVYVYDPALKTFTASTEDLGPILTERANTTGRHKLRFGFTYQRFSFNSLDGSNLHSLPVSFVHVDDMSDQTGNGTSPPVPASNCSINNGVTGPSNTGVCGFVRDRISALTNINLALNQYTLSATFGLATRMDVSIAIPINNIHMNVTSVATIIDNSHTADHQFNPAIVTSCSATPPCLTGTFANSSNATGIGDVVLRAKGVVWSGERAAVAVAADLRLPTGDAQNYLGSGTIGFTPFVIFSYAARISPHVNVGFEENGNSVLAGDIVPPNPSGATPTTPSAFTKGHLPNQFLYSGGLDAVIVRKRLAGTLDLIGQRVFNARRATVTAQSFLGDCASDGAAPGSANYCTTPAGNVTDAALSPTKGSFNIENAAVGAKLRVTDKFVIFGNALIKLNEGGLRANVVPLVGASFSF